MNKEYRVIMTTDAEVAVLQETLRHPNVESGGNFVGTRVGNTFYLREYTDSGMHARYRYGMFERDYDYTDHLAAILASRYEYGQNPVVYCPQHRHPDGVTVFSAGDRPANVGFAKLFGGVVSGLVNIDPKFRLRFWYIAPDGSMTPVRGYEVNDEAVKRVLPLKSADQLIRSIECQEHPELIGWEESGAAEQDGQEHSERIARKERGVAEDTGRGCAQAGYGRKNTGRDCAETEYGPEGAGGAVLSAEYDGRDSLQEGDGERDSLSAEYEERNDLTAECKESRSVSAGGQGETVLQREGENTGRMTDEGEEDDTVWESEESEFPSDRNSERTVRPERRNREKQAKEIGKAERLYRYIGQRVSGAVHAVCRPRRSEQQEYREQRTRNVHRQGRDDSAERMGYGEAEYRRSSCGSIPEETGYGETEYRRSSHDSALEEMGNGETAYRRSSHDSVSEEAGCGETIYRRSSHDSISEEMRDREKKYKRNISISEDMENENAEDRKEEGGRIPENEGREEGEYAAVPPHLPRTQKPSVQQKPRMQLSEAERKLMEELREISREGTDIRVKRISPISFLLTLQVPDTGSFYIRTEMRGDKLFLHWKEKTYDCTEGGFRQNFSGIMLDCTVSAAVSQS